jgi:hypothetical protein
MSNDTTQTWKVQSVNGTDLVPAGHHSLFFFLPADTPFNIPVSISKSYEGTIEVLVNGQFVTADIIVEEDDNKWGELYVNVFIPDPETSQIDVCPWFKDGDMVTVRNPTLKLY